MSTRQNEILAPAAAGPASPVFQPSENALLIRTGKHIEAPTQASELLLGFAFGNATGETPAGVVRLGMQPLTSASATEAWWYEGTVEHTRVGQVRLAESAEFSVLILESDETGQADLKALVAEAYTQLFTVLAKARHKNPVRIWNYLDRINEQQADEERYRLFSSGRAEAFAQFGIADHITPVGTAIGTAGGGKLVIILLASEIAFEVIENPRQVSAYQYPKTYGPHSPKFSRCGLLGQGANPMLLVSGTAAVVGHESTFHFETSRQLDETLINLQVLKQAACPERDNPKTFKPSSTSALRVYLRDASDQALVEQRLQEAWGELPDQMIFLRGDICRSELMIEIEAVIAPD
jgi:chorismate lyase/3-hydroxybenzoate synthase